MSKTNYNNLQDLIKQEPHHNGIHPNLSAISTLAEIFCARCLVLLGKNHESIDFAPFNKDRWQSIFLPYNKGNNKNEGKRSTQGCQDLKFNHFLWWSSIYSFEPWNNILSFRLPSSYQEYHIQLSPPLVEPRSYLMNVW